MRNLFDNISPRWIRIIYTVFAALVLSVTVYNFMHLMFWRVASNDQCRWQQVYTDSTRVHIDGIRAGTPAHRSGLMDGDILLAIDGKLVSESGEAQALLEATEPGDTLQLRIERDHRIKVKLYVRPHDEAGLSMKLSDRPRMTLVITDIVEGGVTDRAGIKEGDILHRIDSVSIRNHFGPSYLLNIRQAGSQAEFLVERSGMLMTFDVRVLKVINYIYLAQFILGFGFLLVGYFVVMARPQGGIQRKFARFGIFAMLFFGLSSVIAYSMYDPEWKVNFFMAMYLLARFIAPPTFIRFFLHFPVRRPLADRRWITPLLYGLTALSVLVLANSRFLFLGDIFAAWIYELSYRLPLIFFFTGLGLFVHSYFRRVKREQRRALRPILHSIIIGTAAILYTIVLNRTYPLAIFLQPYLLLPGLLVAGIPPAFGYAIIKHRLMDVTVIVKRSMVYGLVTAAIAAIYLGIVFGIGSALGTVLGEADNKLLSLIAFVVIALLFDPLKQRVQRIIDRLFYRERYNYQKALLEFSRELPQQINLEQILGSVVTRIAGTMHVEGVSVSLCDADNGCHVMSRDIPEDLCSFEDHPGGVLELLRHTRQPLSLALLEEDKRITDSGDRSKLYRSGIALMVPMFIQDRLLGALNVGAKKSGSPYSQEDIDLLSTVASQAAIAIENARLHRSEIEKQKIKEQLKIAQRIQQGLLPKQNPLIDRLDIAGISIPAMTVGGDYYDYIELPDNRLLVVVGDVSGKGMSAALYMSKVQGMIRFAAQLYDSPKRILSSVNRLIYEGIERNSFITMVLALFDLDSNSITICRAGHTLPLVMLNGDMRFMGSNGMGLGLEPGELFDESLEERRFGLREAGLVLLYSDGLTEAMDSDMNEFSEQRVFEIVSASHAHSAVDLQRHIISEVERHRDGREQNDDITLVVIRVC